MNKHSVEQLDQALDEFDKELEKLRQDVERVKRELTIALDAAELIGRQYTKLVMAKRKGQPDPNIVREREPHVLWICENCHSNNAPANEVCSECGFARPAGNYT